MPRLLKGLLITTLIAWTAIAAHAQISQVNGVIFPLVQSAPSVYGLVPISATAAASAQATLTIPAPAQAGYYNYVCSLHFNASHDGTATTAATNSVTTSTNFNSYAIKFSLNNVANQNTDWVENWGSTPGAGCVKSNSPGTATTFLSPAGAANMQFTWTATYFQAQ
jgi:hypothetical protein